MTKHADWFGRRLAPIACAISWSSSVHATPTDNDEARARAKELALQGDAAFRAGRCTAAIELWRRADDVYHASTIELRIARCQSLLGHVVEATQTLRNVADEKLATDAPVPFLVAQQTAKDELPDVQARVSYLTVNVLTDRKETPAVEIGPSAEKQPDGSYAVNPGKSLVRVRASGETWSRWIAVDEGATREVVVRLVEATPPPEPRTQETIGLFVGGAGLLTLAAGAGFGIAALSLHNDLDEACGPEFDLCPADRAGDIQTLESASMAADVLLVAGGVLTVGGLSLVLTQPNTEQPSTLRFEVGLGQIAAKGAF